MEKEINSVNDILEVLDSSSFQPSLQANIKDGMFYRGQSDFTWTLHPGLYREGLFKSERILITEALHRFPKSFRDLDNFSKLVLMQHHGLKTRLLDVTENPLVALYFACKSNFDLDGAFYIFSHFPTFYSNDRLVETIMEYIFRFSGTSVEENDFLEYFRSFKYSRFDRRRIAKIEELIYDLTLQSVFISPKLDNPRIIAQQGAFMIFGMDVDNEKAVKDSGIYRSKYIDFKEQGPIDVASNIIKFRVPSNSKERIIKQLNYLNINEGSLFLDLDHQLNYLNHVVKEYTIYRDFDEWKR